MAESDDEEFRLPRNHRIEENLDTEGLEQASLDRPIHSSNVGFQLMLKMGWRGIGLGRQEQGIVDPIRTDMRDQKLGVGKQEEDDWYTAQENVQRKKLEVEVEETEEVAKKREEEAAKVEKTRQEVQEIRKTFFCELCSKQYKLASEFETHLSSYDHNHKKRFKENVRAQKAGGREERVRREQQRHEREMARLSQMAKEAREQQQVQGQDSQASPAAAATSSCMKEDSVIEAKAAAPPLQFNGGMKTALKFGFGSKKAAGKAPQGAKDKKGGSLLPSVFGVDDDD